MGFEQSLLLKSGKGLYTFGIVADGGILHTGNPQG